MTFKIVVCVKQVPDTTDIRWTENNTIQREGLDSVINPFDIGAIKIANDIKSLINNVEIHVVSMGPLQAKETLYQALTMGCDKAYLLCDKRFSGADTLATAYTLSQFIKKVVPDFNLILCGQQAVDGDTAQTPSSMAEKLKIEQVTNVIDLKNINETESVWTKDTCNYTQDIKVNHPALISTLITNTEIVPTINAYIKATETDINILTVEDIEANLSLVGLKGSPTQVKNAFRPVITRVNELIENESPEKCAQFILEQVNNCRV